MIQKDKYYQLLDQYVNGNLTREDRHDLEKQALDDPFFFDALEGWMALGKNVDHRRHLMSLFIKMKRKKQESLARRIIWPIAIAASLILLFTVGNILIDDPDQSLASQTPEEVANTDVSDLEQEPEEEENQSLISKESVNSEDEESRPVDDKPSVLTSPPTQKSDINRDIAGQKKKPIESPLNMEDVATAERDESMEVASVEQEQPGMISPPTTVIKKPAKPPLSALNKSMMKNNSQNTMSMQAGVLEIIDPGLDDYITKSLSVKGQKVLSSQRNSYDITFDSTLTIKDIKLSSRENDFSESIQELILAYKSWKKETIPPNLFGRYHYPPQ